MFLAAPIERLPPQADACTIALQRQEAPEIQEPQAVKLGCHLRDVFSARGTQVLSRLLAPEFRLTDLGTLFERAGARLGQNGRVVGRFEHGLNLELGEDVASEKLIELLLAGGR